MDTKDIFKNVSTILTFGTILSFIFGYQIISGYLTSYNVINDDILNLNFIKTGFSFLIFFIPILIIIYINYKKPTDNFRLSWKCLIALTINILTYLLWLSFFLIDFHKLHNFEIVLFMVSIFIDNILYFFVTSYAFKDVKYLIKIIMHITIPIFAIILLCMKLPYLCFIYGTIILTSIVFIVALGLISDKKASWGHYSLYLIWFCFVAYLYGLKCYQEIPKFIKGGYPNSVMLICKIENVNYLNKIGFNFNNSTYVDSVTVLYSTTEKLLINKNNKIFFVTKDLFNGYLACPKPNTN